MKVKKALKKLAETVFQSNWYPNKKIIGYSYFEQLKDISPSICLSVFMGVIVYIVGYLDLPLFVCMLLQVFVGIVIYIAGSILLKIDSYYYVLDVIVGFLRGKNGNKNANV